MGLSGLLVLCLPLAALEREPLAPPGEGPPGFSALPAERTGIRFANALGTRAALENRILENGSGVAAADVDSDGLCDLYFCGMDVPNALYRNLGGLRFEEIAARAGVACEDQRSSGAAFADLDGDGDPDLLVTGPFSGIRCFVNQGGGRFEESGSSGLDRRAASTSLALADAEGDGDLDLYAASYRSRTWKDLPPGIRPRTTWRGGRPVAWPADRFVARRREDGSAGIVEIGQPDGFYLNDGRGRFVRESWTGGRFLEADGSPLAAPPRNWGLAAAFRDFDGDALPDLYVCNDFLHGGDDFFLNLGGGRFGRAAPEALRHTSWSSMAVDVSDIDADGSPDFLVADMLSPDPVRRLRQQANLETGRRLLPPGLRPDRPQVQQNTLFLGRGDGTWAEIARLAGLDASGWSWCVVFLDVDLDGYEDVLVGNGHAHDLLDSDATRRAAEAMRRSRGRRTLTLGHYPPLPLADRAWRNRGDLSFEEAGRLWGFDRTGITQGLARADLDNDGDWDLALNLLRERAVVLENTGAAPRIQVALSGEPPNTAGIGAQARLLPEGPGPFPVQRREMAAGGRYLSSDQPRLAFAGGDPSRSFRLQVDWRSGRRSVLRGVRPGYRYTVAESGAAEAPDPPAPRTPPAWFEDATDLLGHVHQEAPFNDLLRQPLLPRLHSRPGPGLAWADADGDGREDLLVSGGAGGRTALLRNRGAGGFRERGLSADPGGAAGILWLESGFEGLVLSPSNYRGGSRSLPSLRFLAAPSLDPVSMDMVGQRDSTGPILSLDYDGDGDLDLFVGGRVVPGRWPETPVSRLYRNRQGRFRLDREAGAALARAGMVQGAAAPDIDGDGDCDLVLATDWGRLQLWRNQDGRFEEVPPARGLGPGRGLWQGVAAADFDEDGRIDIAAANRGRNTGYQRFLSHPLRVRHGDLDGDGSVETVELVRDPARGRWVPLQGLEALQAAIPALRLAAPSHQALAERGPAPFLGSAWEEMDTLQAGMLESVVLLNRGDRFLAVPLPAEAQFAPAWGVVAADFTGDGHEDLFLAQNCFGSRPAVVRHDAGLGLLLAGGGDGAFSPLPPSRSGIRIWGEQRGAAAADFDADGRLDLAVGQNAAPTRLFRNRGAPPAHRVRLQGPPSNPRAVGARLRWADGTGPLRQILGGSGLLSQDSPVTLWPVSPRPRELEILWPGGKASRLALEGAAREWIAAFPE